MIGDNLDRSPTQRDNYSHSHHQLNLTPLTALAVDCGSKPEYPERIYTDSGKKHTTPHIKAVDGGFEPRTFCEATVLPTAPLFHHIIGGRKYKYI